MQTFAFRTIADALREEILSGAYAVGDSLPPERVLAERFGASLGTVRVALKELVAEGIVDGSRGRPKTVVRVPRQRSSFDEFHSFAQWARGKGREPGGRVVESVWQIADETDERLLQAPRGTRVLNVVRVRMLDGDVVMLERTRYAEWVGELVQAIPAEASSVTMVLAEHGVRFTHAEHRFGAEGAKARDAQLLGVARGSALLTHRRVSRDPNGRILEWSIDRYIAGKIVVSVGNSWNQNPLTWTVPDAS
ncbi:GntR family transcriptional regulator [Microbacterium amylolyticum]|uniref:GntR family transcriptional regulator n=1 Tax=Microbacterium amylolyticum TaxID=936337 RepID=A0ABS4ZDW2_9MICO|nr:GntR family transcriptional regulator [Microbacterium amylolyticum]MBP2435422.1 GntR family transcriptional regulator [Microbacterium amylolyticum]